ncbi:hypothetical protein EOL70_06240 [Leucothrix sargassi]|nr:hypothetical protein EOL70_06240 [Leucothrix sargassi]
MNIFRVFKVITAAVVTAMALGMMSLTHAVSSSGTSKIKDYKLVHFDGGEVRRSHVSIAVRRGYPGVVPKITKRATTDYPNCYDVKFIYKNELRRLTFNCANGTQQLTMMTR